MSDTQHALPHGADCDCYECFGRALGTLAWESTPREEATPYCVVCQQEGHTFRDCPAARAASPASTRSAISWEF